jgi:diguanylate cyclase (GGDEF)-like protein/PAS domain S-box-containing protein
VHADRRHHLEHWAFLRHIDTLKPGKSGFIFVMTGKGVLLHHPNRDRLLKNINERQGTNQGTQKALAGFEGWMEATNKDGSDGIYSYRRMKAADWIVGARFPMDEAFAPMMMIQRHALLMAALVALIAGILALLVISRLFAPLEALRSNVSAIRKQRANIEVLQVARNDEIGELSMAFHGLMAEREAALERTSESERRARIIADAVPALISYINSDLRYEFSNANYESFMGVTPAAMIGKAVRDILGEDIYASIESYLLAALRGEAQHFEQEVMVRGNPSHLLIDYIPNVAENGVVRGLYVLALDISQRKQVELTLAASEKRLQLITDNLPVLIAYLDSDHRFRFGNATFEKWFGIDPQALPGRPLADVVGEEIYELARLHLDNAFSGWAVTYEVKASIGGTMRMLETTYVPDIQANGEVAGVYALTHDMTRMKDVEEKLMQLARVDTLTGIANRRMFGENLQHAIERAHRHAGSMALAYLDIDHFKKINDTHGHGVGDEVLREFARRLADNVRATDAVARLSGDEFVIILEDLKGALEINTVANKVIAAIRVPIATSIGPLAVTASVGIALFFEGQNNEELLGRADAALYAAKRAGRDRFNVDGW